MDKNWCCPSVSIPRESEHCSSVTSGRSQAVTIVCLCMSAVSVTVCKVPFPFELQGGRSMRNRSARELGPLQRDEICGQITEISICFMIVAQLQKPDSGTRKDPGNLVIDMGT